MKARELIEKLQAVDPERDVVIEDADTDLLLNVGYAGSSEQQPGWSGRNQTLKVFIIAGSYGDTWGDRSGN